MSQEKIEIDTKSAREREFNPEASGLINASFLSPIPRESRVGNNWRVYVECFKQTFSRMVITFFLFN